MTHTTLPAPTDVGTYAPPAPRPAEPSWPPALRIAFRFACAWLVLVFWLDLLAAFPALGAAAGWAHERWAPALTWVGAHVLHTAAPAVDYPNGAGDKTIFWVGHFVALVLAGVAAALWSALDRRRTDYRVAHDRLRVYVRYTLGATMLGYGVAKLLPSQFPALALTRYIEPYGQFSPMGVLWSMMSTSPAYGAFTGAVETTGALLLFWRCTTTLGALVTAGALANVFALNMTYDVTVKGYSLQLLLAALFLLLPDARRLWDVLVRHAAVPARPLGSSAVGPRTRAAHRVLKPLVVATIVGYTSYGTWSFWRDTFGAASHSPLRGIYDVERLVQNGAERPPLLSDSARWRRVVFDRRRFLSVQLMTDSLRGFLVKDDSTAHRLALTGARDSTQRATLAYVRLGPARLQLAGRVGADSVELTLRRVDHTRFPLLSRGFRWVQDDNFNR